MKLIIDIDERKYKIALKRKENFPRDLSRFESIIANGEPYQEWIPVSERLPKIAGVYRVTRYYPNNVINVINKNYIVDACFFDGSNTWHSDNRINHERDYAYNVIAWQENPEPYKESEDNG